MNSPANQSETSGSTPTTGGEDESGQRIAVTVDAEEGEPPDLSPRWLGDRLNAAADRLGVTDLSLSVVVVDDDRMATLHARYSGETGTTDVLTFDLRDEPFDGSPEAGLTPPVEGELVLCLDEARRRAAERGHPVDKELLLYAVHGLLHLVGYDDHDPEDRRRMHAREDELLEAIGVGPVYGGDED